MRRDRTRNIAQFTGRRLPVANEIYKQYRSAGTGTPQDLGESVLRHYAELAQKSVVLGEPYNRAIKNSLLGMVHYELGIVTHAQKPVEASRHFTKSLAHLEADEASDTGRYLQQQNRLHLTRLMQSRTSPDERLHKLQQRATVRTLGKLVVAGTEIMPKLPRDEQSSIYGTLVELAFAGTLLADGQSPTTYVGLPTTERQDKPLRHISYKQAIAGVQPCESVDLNILSYDGSDQAPTDVTRAQIKSKEPGEPGLYSEDILMLYADWDLFVENKRELRRFGRSLAGFTGSPNRQLATAYSNIELAYEVHQAPISVASSQS